MIILGKPESFKTMTRPDRARLDPVRTLCYLTANFSDTMKDANVQFRNNLHSFMSSKSISLIVWKLCAFLQRSNIKHFQ